MGWGRSKAYDGEKAQTSEKQSILSGKKNEQIMQDDICMAAFILKMQALIDVSFACSYLLSVNKI